MNLEIPIELKMGYIKFLNCKIDLSKKVFIPRIETEFWLAKAIKELRTLNFEHRTLKILDIFAGSGCIGIVILKVCPELCRRVDFVDIDKRAIEQIKINLKLNKISKNRYQIYKSNLFEKLKGKKYDFIFANPPYVAKERLNEVQNSVKKYEPKIAWYGEKKGLRLISKFLKEAKNYLKKNGIIFLEFDPLQKKSIEDILEKDYNPPATLPSKTRALNYNHFKFFKDQFKKFRYAKIWLKT